MSKSYWLTSPKNPNSRADVAATWHSLLVTMSSFLVTIITFGHYIRLFLYVPSLPPRNERYRSSGRPGCARGFFMRVGRPGTASTDYYQDRSLKGEIRPLISCASIINVYQNYITYLIGRGRPPRPPCWVELAAEVWLMHAGLTHTPCGAQLSQRPQPPRGCPPPQTGNGPAPSSPTQRTHGTLPRAGSQGPQGYGGQRTTYMHQSSNPPSS